MNHMPLTKSPEKQEKCFPLCSPTLSLYSSNATVAPNAGHLLSKMSNADSSVISDVSWTEYKHNLCLLK